MVEFANPASDAVTTTRWWWVRHAPVPDGGRIYGQRDLDCDCSDERVFRSVARVLPRDAVWVTSDLKRAKQTAAAIELASDGALPSRMIPALAALNEQHLGDWQGRERNEFRLARGFTVMDFWLTKGDERAPNGESYHDLVGRVVPVIEDMTRARAGRNIVAVAHGGTIRAALGHAMAQEVDAAHAFVIDNVSVTVLEHMTRGAASNGKVDAIWRIGTVNFRPWVAL